MKAYKCNECSHYEYAHRQDMGCEGDNGFCTCESNASRVGGIMRKMIHEKVRQIMIWELR